MASPNPIISPVSIGAIPTTEKAAAMGVATLGPDSKIPSAQLPAIAITDVFSVASQAAMLALTAQRGDVAVRTDIPKSFILSTDDPTILANWIELKTAFGFGFVAGDIAIGTAPDTISPLPAGTVGQTLKMVDSGLPGWERRTNPAKEIELFDHFIGTGAGRLGWYNASSVGTADTAPANTDNKTPGILRLHTGASAAGRGVRSLANAFSGVVAAGFIIGNGPITVEMRVRIDTLSTGTEEFSTVLGLSDQTNLDTNAIRFLYQRTVSTNWLISAMAGGVATNTSSGVPVVAGVWYKLRYEINALGTSVEYFIDGVSVGTVTTNIPAGVIITPTMRCVKSIGTTGRYTDVDYYYLYQRLTTGT